MLKRFWPLGGALGVSVWASLCLAQANFVENFDNNGPGNPGDDGPANLIARGWRFRNQSSPRGSRSWFDGFTGTMPQQAGTGYLAVDSLSTDFFGGAISNWAILPDITGQQSGEVMTFWIRAMSSSNADTMQVRYSPDRGTNTGSGANDVGDFTQLLRDIDPIPTAGWTRYEIPLPGEGRIAFRYFVSQACNFACFGSYVGLDTLGVGQGPPPPCNQPPVPTPGQAVTWTAAGSPYQVCQNIAIPASSSVLVQPGVVVNFDANRQLAVAGTLTVQGTSGLPVTFSAPAVFPPMITVNGGILDASFAEFGGQVLVESGASVLLSDCRFAGLGLLRSQELPSTPSYVELERCRFESSSISMSDALVVLRNNTFVNSFAQILRGYADVTAPNNFVGQPLTIIRESNIQPLRVEGVNTNGVSGGAGLILDGGTYLLGSGNVFQNNLYPLELRGGLLPGSTVPASGNTINVIAVGPGGFAGIGRWANLGLPYRLTELSGDLPGGQLTIDPGVTIEGLPGTRMIFRSTRRLIAEGLPGQPITFRSAVPGQTWSGLAFATNSTTGTRLEYCTIRGADLGTVVTDSTAFVDNCVFERCDVGANANTFGSIFIRKTEFLSNVTGVSMTDLGHPNLNSPTNPNVFEGNTSAIDAFESGSEADAANVWWGHPTGPQHPANPGGLGDPIVGPGAAGVSIFPFLTSRPDFANTPPVLRLLEPGFDWTFTSPAPDYLLDQGTKFVVRWDVQDGDAIVSQRILFSPDGHVPDRFVTVEDLPPDQRSYEWEVPNPGFALTGQPQFLRVEAVDAAGQQGWDQTPMVVPSGRLTGELIITTNLSGQTFFAGQPIPTMTWTGSVSGLPTIDPFVVLEADGATVGGVNVGGQGVFFSRFPTVSTDAARLALRAHHNSNDVAWFFADGYFSIRHDPRLNLEPPSVALVSPAPGSAHRGGTVVLVTWTASDDEGLYSFDIQASYDGGRTWHLVARDLPGTARSFNWLLPPSQGIPDVRLRVIARDTRFQNNTDGADGSFAILAGGGGPPGDLDGDGDVDLSDFTVFQLCFGGSNNPPAPTCPAGADADLDGDGDVDLADFLIFQQNFTGSL